MSVGPLGGVVGSAAGTASAQAKGSDADRAAQDVAVQQRHSAGDARAADAAGIAATEGEDKNTADRDADGRRFWEEPPKPGGDSSATQNRPASPRQSKDATGQSGQQLDLTG